jgi:hypothetical protein
MSELCVDNVNTLPKRSGRKERGRSVFMVYNEGVRVKIEDEGQSPESWLPKGPPRDKGSAHLTEAEADKVYEALMQSAERLERNKLPDKLLLLEAALIVTEAIRRHPTSPLPSSNE